jgi:hypothetical protein
MVWNILNNLTAGSRVAYDKTVDYLFYYLNLYGDRTDEEIEIDSDINDHIDDYQDFLTVEKFKDEHGNKRILPEVTYTEAVTTFFNDPTHIIDNIYLGSAFNAASYDTLKKHNIKVILNITKEISNYFPNEFIYERCNIYDNNKHSIQKFLQHIYSRIKYHQENTDGNILVHCYMGASRSASVVIYYLMNNTKFDDGTPYTFEDSLNYMKNKRIIVNPSFRFTKDLAMSFVQDYQCNHDGQDDQDNLDNLDNDSFE